MEDSSSIPKTESIHLYKEQKKPTNHITVMQTETLNIQLIEHMTIRMP
jgi:intein-encoded DNA endonuclease-like protein